MLKLATKVLVYGYVLNDAPVMNQAGQFDLQLDMIMLACHNARERTAAQFKELTTADPRFVLTGVHRPAGSAMSLVEVTWTFYWLRPRENEMRSLGTVEELRSRRAC